jgi:hypothetical protein
MALEIVEFLMLSEQRFLAIKAVKHLFILLLELIFELHAFVTFLVRLAVVQGI